MTANFDLGPKHLENKKNAEQVIANIESCDAVKVIKELYSQSYGIIPSQSTAYDDYLGLAVVVEEVAKSKPEAASLLVDQITAQEIFNKYASFSDFDSNKIYAILCSEPGVALVDAMKTTAVKVDGGFKVEGVKQITNEQALADEFLVIAKDEDEKTRIFSVSKSDIEFETVERAFNGKKVKINQAKVSAVVADSAVTINDNFEKVQTVSRTLIASVATGIAHSAILSGVAAVKQTKGPDNQAIASTQSAQFALADLFAELEMGRVLTYLSANLIDDGKANIKNATMAKVQASNAATKVSVEALQLLGNVGYMACNEFADSIKAAINCQVKGGTNRVQKNQLYGYLMAKK